MNEFLFEKKVDSIVLGGGCFWCLEAVFLHIKGVLDVISGYAGGNIENPTYEQVSNGKTNHAEVVKITFDEKIISLEDILHIFFAVHDPTTPNRQGNDIGTQYRSIILFADTEQKTVAEKVMAELAAEKIYAEKIVTEIKPLEKFYIAEQYHQKYFEKNPTQAYCQIVIAPKISKLREKYKRLYK